MGDYNFDTNNVIFLCSVVTRITLYLWYIVTKQLF